jgi:hypothetical protein
MKKVLFQQRSSGKNSKGRHRHSNRLVQALRSVPRCEFPPERSVVRMTVDPDVLDSYAPKRILRYIGATGRGDNVKVTADLVFESYPDMGYSEPLPFDHLPKHERMGAGRYQGDAEWCVGPLRRFLRSMVGKPWREVEAALRRKVGNQRNALNHLQDFLANLVERNVLVTEDGQVFNCKTGEFAYSHGTDRFFVHATTGILGRLPNVPRAQKKDTRQFEQKPMNERQKLVKLCGIWYVVDFQPIPHASTLEWDSQNLRYKGPVDIVLRTVAAYDPRADWVDYSSCKPKVQNLGTEKFVKEWGGPIYAVRKQQANSALLRAHGVRND